METVRIADNDRWMGPAAENGPVSGVQGSVHVTLDYP